MINRFISPDANLLNLSAMCLWWDPSTKSGHTHLTKDKKSFFALFCIFFSASRSCICLKVLRTSAGNFSIFTLFKSMVPKCFQYTQMSKLCNTTCSSGTPFCKRGDRGKIFFGFLDLDWDPWRVSARVKEL
jgi:hypothetical protein